MQNNIKKYDIWLINLEPTKWWKQSWIRPCLVFQSDMISDFSTTFIVLPITSKEKRISSFIVTLNDYKKFWLSKFSTILSFQIRTADKSRFIKKLWSINDNELRKKIKESLILSIDLDDDFLE